MQAHLTYEGEVLFDFMALDKLYSRTGYGLFFIFLFLLKRTMLHFIFVLFLIDLVLLAYFPPNLMAG